MENIDEVLGYNPYLLSEIQPQGGVKFQEDKIIKGDGYEACLDVFALPKKELDAFWLDNILNIPNTIGTVDIATENKSVVLKKIEKALAEQESRYNDSIKRIEKQNAKREYAILEALAEEVMNVGEVIKLIKMRIYVASPLKTELEESIRRVRKTLEDNHFQAIVLINEQEYEYQSLFTNYAVQKEYNNKRIWKPIPSLSLGGGVPFHYTSINDPRGLYIGTTSTGGSVIFDLFNKNKNRISYSALVMGKPGAGKSTLLKKLILNNSICGNFIRVIDITGEFGSLIKRLGGKEIFLDGTGDIINPLQIYPTIMDEKTNLILEDKCFASNLSKLNNLYRTLKPNCNEDEISEFEILVCEFYEEYGIKRENCTQYRNEEYPILEELLEFVNNKLYDKDNKTVKKNLTPTTVARLESIKLILSKLILNYGSLFNGHSTIGDITKEQLISYNCSNLKQLDKRIFVSQLFTTLSSVWGQALVHGRKEKYDYEKENKSEDEVSRFLLIMDEAHNFINVNNMSSVEIVITMIREFRKFFGGVVLANHNVSDYVPENSKNDSVLEEIKKIFTMTQYKFIMRQDVSEKDILKKIFKGVLSDSEIERIPRFSKGHCILCIDGLSNITFKVEIDKEEEILFEGGA